MHTKLTLNRKLFWWILPMRFAVISMLVAGTTFISNVTPTTLGQATLGQAPPGQATLGQATFGQDSDSGNSKELDDPSTDGWDTEAFHLEAKSQLDRLAKLIDSSTQATPLDETTFSKSSAKIFLKDAYCYSLQPPNHNPVFEADGVLVQSADVDSPQETSQRLTPHQTLKELVAPFERQLGDSIEKTIESEKALRVEFKIFKVNKDGRDPITRQYVAIFGSCDVGMMEYFAEWEIVWEQEQHDTKPMIKSINLIDLQQSYATNSKSPLLVDLTSQVLGGNRSYRAQHRYGLNYWNSRIETDLNRDLMGHQGIAIGDVNGDRLEDIYVCQTGGLPNRLYLNKGDGTAEDISDRSGVNFLDQSTGALFVDFDNDGDQDLLVGMYHGTAILSNDGKGKFEQKAFFDQASHIYSPTAVDFDRDGDLDVYLCVYYPDGSNSQEFPFPYPFDNATNGGRNIFLQNEGNFQFTNVTTEVGLDENNTRYSYSAGWEDFDGDGDMDLYVANDFGANNLFVNENGKFNDLTEQYQAEDGNFGMSVSWGDFDLDGWSDIYISNMFSGAGNRIVPQAGFNPDLDSQSKASFLKLARGNSLLRNHSGKTFEDVSIDAGVNLGRWAWSSVFADMNNDGWEDILVGNGYITGEDSGDL